MAVGTLANLVETYDNNTMLNMGGESIFKFARIVKKNY